MKPGICHICGNETLLSFEHFPPESTNNNKAVKISNFNDVFGKHPLEPINGKINQRGLGKNCLCESCNSKTGLFYVNDYKLWFDFGMFSVKKCNNFSNLHCKITISVLSIFKQIIVFFMDGDSKLRIKYPELSNFIIEKESNLFPETLRVFCYITKSTKGKSIQNITKVNLLTKQSISISEFTFYPFGYVLCHSGEKPDNRLMEITYFKNFKYGEKKEIDVSLTCLPVLTMYPCDYRDLKQIEFESKKST